MRRSRRSYERGEGALGCIFWTVVLALAVLIAWKMIPVKVASAQLLDYMDEQAKLAAQRTPDQIRRGILKKAADLDLPVDERSVQVEKPGDQIKMRVEYVVPVEFPGYTYEWEFVQVIDRPIFIF